MSKFLVIDDSLTERTAVCEILRRRGHTVVEANDGAKAVDMAKLHTPDAIIMDIVMKEMDGFSATKRVKAVPECKHIPIVMLSSKSQQSDRFRAEQLGASKYLVKPVTLDALLEALPNIV